MKTYLKFFVFLLVFSKISAQTIKGIVVDAKTNEPLPSANVYVNSSTKGTQTDLNGRFGLSNVPLGNVQLIISYVGYEISQQNLIIEPDKTTELRINLLPNNQLLTEVSVKTKKDKSWEKDLKLFRRLFLGDSPQARQCKILNEWVLDFDRYPVSGAFVATAQQPLEIENRALGYKLIYHLKEFSNTATLTKFIGTSHFQELEPTDEKELKAWETNRKSAYLGSIKHFFKSMIEGTVQKEGFAVYQLPNKSDYLDFKKDFKKIDYIVSEKNLNKIFQAGSKEYFFLSKLPIEVVYGNPNVNNNLGSTRLQPNRPFSVTSEGWINDPLAFEVTGVWGNERIANFLPQDYAPQIVNNPSVTAAQIYNFPRVYVHTNKSDYVAGERIWLSAYLTEGKNHVLLQENRPLYIQLYNGKSEMVSDEIIYASNGRGAGFLSLNDSLMSGVYQLKAFTKEMLNAPAVVFSKELVIHHPQSLTRVVKKPAIQPNNIETEALKISIVSDKLIYKPKEKVTLTIKSENLSEAPVSATFSLAVVDINRLFHQPEETDINAVLTTQIADIQPITNLYRKENTLTLKGIIRHQKTGKPLPNRRVVAILLDSLSHLTKSFESDKEGKFVVDKINSEGVKTFVYDVVDKKGKTDPMAVLYFEEFPPKVHVSTVSFDKATMIDKQLKQLVYTNQNPDGQQPKPTYEPIIVENTKEEKKADNTPAGVTKLYSKADYSIEFTDKSPRFMNVYEMLQGTLPGVRVVGNPTGGYRIWIRGIGTWNDNNPLILLDGMQVEIGALGGFINPNDVQRIDLLSPGATAGIYGVRGANGVIAIYTKRTNESDLIKPTTKRYIVKGYQREEAFIEKNYSTQMVDNQADMRTTIYWNPEIITNEKGEATISFYTANPPTTYRIIIEGISAKGEIGRKETRIIVR